MNLAEIDECALGKGLQCAKLTAVQFVIDV